MNDLRLASRALARTPVATLTIVLTMAAGIAGTTAIASVANAMLFPSLPYANPERLVIVGRGPEAINSGINLATFRLLRDRFTSCRSIGATTGRPGINLTAGGNAEYVTNALATAAYFEAIGIAPVRGRSFRLEDEDPGRPGIAIIAEGLAVRAFGSVSSAVGRTLTLGSRSVEVVGVVPQWTGVARSADVWLPLSVQRMNDQGLNYLAACRLNEGRTHQEALAELALLQPDYAALHQGESMKQLASQSLGIVGIKEWQTRTQRPMVMMLVIAVGVVLLIACMNSAWLFSARAIDRRSETAVRVALGAGYGRVARQILAESLLLTLMGGIVGIGITAWALPPLLSLSADALTWRADMDFAVIGGIVVLSVAVGMLCGLVPALKYARLDPIEALQAGSRRMASSRDAALTRRIMVVSEVTLCMVLIVTSGLLVRSLGSLHQVDTGFDPTNVITAQVSLDDATYRSREAVSLFYDRVIDNVRAHPDVVEAAVITNVPIDRGLNLPIVPPIPIAGLPIASVDWRYVTEGYFRAMGVQLRAGREFATSDQAESTPVAVVNEAFVARFLPEVNPLGLQVQLNRMMGLSDSREIVGVVANTLQQGLSTAPPPIMYVPVRQVPDPFIGQVHQFFPMSFVVRYRSGPTGFSEALNQAIRTVDARIPISRVRTMAQVIDDATGGARFQAVLFSVFGLVSVLMAITALGGSVLYAVMRRKRDIGIRLALGASVPGMLRTVVGENVALSAAGIAAGAAGAFMLRQALRPFLFGVTPTDLATYIGAGMMLFLVALAATVAAAAPVLRIDPARTLRVE